MKYKIEPLTLQDIRELSSNYLRFVIREGQADPKIHSMIEEELIKRQQTTFFDGKNHHIV